MKKLARSILPLTALAILLISAAPMVNASTLTVNLNPTTGLAKVDSVSTTQIVFTYPAGSSMSSNLKNASSSLDLNGSFAGNSNGAKVLQGSFDAEDNHISVRNMSVAITYTAVGNSTTFVVNKMTNVTAWVSGVFSVVNGSVTADLGWRSFIVRGALELPFQDHSVDINLVGSAMEASLGARATAAGFLLGAFGGGDIWNRPTLNFSALNSPLSTWTKNYDASTNTTTFSKTISGESTFSASIDYNGQKYSLSAVSDPSGEVSVQGYASASGDSLVISPAPASSAYTLMAVAAAFVVVAAAVGYLAFRSRARSPSRTTTLPA